MKCARLPVRVRDIDPFQKSFVHRCGRLNRSLRNTQGQLRQGLISLFAHARSSSVASEPFGGLPDEIKLPAFLFQTVAVCASKTAEARR